jgi:hypothetical protein
LGLSLICLILLEWFPFLRLSSLDLVPLDKKLHKQHQVASVHDQGSRIVFRFQSTLLFIARRQHETEGSNDHANNHLRDLGYGNPDAVEPFGLALDGHQEVIKVHEGVNSKVHGDKEQTSRGLGDICMPAIQQNRNVVVPVQEDERLFVNDNEKCVQEFAA